MVYLTTFTIHLEEVVYFLGTIIVPLIEPHFIVLPRTEHPALPKDV